MKTKLFGIAVAVVCVGSVFGQVLQHEVRDGETLYSIAGRYDTTIDHLIETNGIASPELLLPGTLLTISSRYAVQKGDTLYGIAQRFDTSVDELVATNELRDTQIRVGQIILLPDTANTANVAQGPPEDNRDSGTTETSEPSDPSNRTPDPITVAAEVSEPINFEDGGVWPVAGTRRRLEGKLPGIMIGAERGSPVYAVSAGRVVYAGPHTTFGNVVFIQTAQNYVYVYGGQETVGVEVGQLIEAGAAIGTVGLSPSEGTAALYFSVWRDDRFIDPESAPRG